MRYFLSFLVLAVLCVLHSPVAGKKWVAKPNAAAADIAAAEKYFDNRALTPSPSLRQTTWQEIEARRVSRTSPFYKRQMTSGVPISYPTCSITYPGSNAVARYQGIEMAYGDLTPKPLNATTENECLQLCIASTGCIGYFYKPKDYYCYTKASLSAISFISDSAAATSAGAVSGLLGTCVAAASKGVPSSANNVCCDGQMAAGSFYPTCSVNYSGDIAVARFTATEFFYGDSSIAPGPVSAANERMCLQICKQAADCVAYFYKASERACYPKSSWGLGKIGTGSDAALSPGAVSGVLGSCKSAAAQGITPNEAATCCDSQMSAQAFGTCPAASPGDIPVARYLATELSGGDSSVAKGPISAANEAACLQICKGTSDCIGYFYRASALTCWPKATWVASGFLSQSTAALSAGAVTGLLSTCNAAAVKGVPTSFSDKCCDSLMSALAWPTCSATTAGDNAVARYLATELTGGDSSVATGPINATNEVACLQICKQTSDCIGYFYRASALTCWPKATWVASGFRSQTAAALSAGAVSGLLGTCNAAAVKGVPTSFSDQCCDSQMSALAFPTCPVTYPGAILVARYPATELSGSDSTVAKGPITVTNEAACLLVCKQTSDCIGYFYRASLKTCWPKAGWAASGFLSQSAAALSAGAVTGLLSTCNAAAVNGVPTRLATVCCDASMGTSYYRRRSGVL